MTQGTGHAAGSTPPNPLTELAERAKRFTPANCPHCEYDRQFPGFEGGGWIQQDNNGPIVSCPVCNDDGSHYRARAASESSHG